MSRFSYSSLPAIRIPRSRFDLSHRHETTVNTGDLIPFCCLEVNPGDSRKVEVNFVARTTGPFMKPVMDNLFADMWFFFVPHRLVMEDWEEVFGYNPSGPWQNKSPATVPLCTMPSVAAGSKGSKDFLMTLADYFGDVVPGEDMNLNMKQPNQLAYRAFAKVWNDWFVSEATGTPVVVEPVSGTLNTNAWSPANIFGKPPKIYKMHDRFTSASPSPQKGDPVTIPLLGNAPVKTASTDLVTGPGTALHLRSITGDYLPSSAPLVVGNAENFGALSGVGSESGLPAATYYPSNLFADMTDVTASNVNDLRFAFQLQKMLERDSAFGNRYTEILQAQYGVHAPDQRLQRSEYLGGSRNPISIYQVTQTTGSNTEDAPLGQVGAFSLSGGAARFNKGFTEHGYVLGLMAIRQFHTYQQGLEKAHTRTQRIDFYNNIFSNIGNQPIYTYELYRGVSNPDQIFGYTEAWNEYRQTANRISGALRSTMDNGLDVWHFGDYYASAPVLSDEWLQENADNVDRTLSVQSETAPQFIFDFWIEDIAIRGMPTYGMPGLIDHH